MPLKRKFLRAGWLMGVILIFGCGLLAPVIWSEVVWLRSQYLDYEDTPAAFVTFSEGGRPMVVEVTVRD